MTPLYRENPTMFADEPARFIVVMAAIVLPLAAGFLFAQNLLGYLAVVSVLAALYLGWWYIVNRSTVVTVDEERITLRRGVFNIENIEVELGKVRTVRVDQTLADRIFNCGILKVFTAGDNPDIVQDGLPDPVRLRNALRTAQAD